MAKAQKSGFYKVSAIGLDPDNFRHKPVDNSMQAIKEMLADKKHKVIELAQDIVDMGTLDPSSKLIIRADSKNKGHYVVLEGNRRITALKVLTTPGLASGTADSARYAKLSKDFLKDPITEIECVELTPAEAKKWVKRKHYNAMGGVGTLPWDALATARSDAAEGKYAKWLAVVNFLENQGYSIDAIMEGIARKTTSVERVLSSSHLKKILGVSIAANGSVTFDNNDKKGGGTLLYALLEEMAKASFIEPLVSTAIQQEDFLGKFKHLSTLKSQEAHLVLLQEARLVVVRQVSLALLPHHLLRRNHLPLKKRGPIWLTKV